MKANVGGIGSNGLIPNQWIVWCAADDLRRLERYQRRLDKKLDALAEKWGASRKS